MSTIPLMMKAATYRGKPGARQVVLATAMVPKPASGQILVKVEASAVNPIDWKLRQGALGILTALTRLTPIPGFDFVGRVTALGPDVSSFSAGDRVFGMLNFKTMGSLSEYVIANVAETASAGHALDDATLAGLPLAGMTALQSIRNLGSLSSGQRLLVIGGSGGVGHIGVQLGKALGAHVTAITGPRNVEFVQGLGADTVINYAEGNEAEGPFDVILDTVVSKPYQHWAKCLTDLGVYVSVLPNLELLIRSRMTATNSGRKVRIIGVKPLRSDLEVLRDLAETAKLKLSVDNTYPLEKAREALERSQSGRARGKIILTA